MSLLTVYTIPLILLYIYIFVLSSHISTCSLFIDNLLLIFLPYKYFLLLYVNFTLKIFFINVLFIYLFI